MSESLLNQQVDLPGGPQVRVQVFDTRQVEVDFRAERSAIWAPRARVYDVAFEEDDVDRLAKDVEHAEGIHELALLLAAAREASKKLGLVIRAAEGELAARMEGNVVTIDGFGTLTKRYSTSNEWDDDLVIGAVIDAAMEQGTHPRDAILATAGVSYWRTGALKELGIDPDRYRRGKGTGRHTVQITRADAA